MLLGEVFERFVKNSPITVMVRLLLENALNPAKVDELFERVAQEQYTQELLFSTVVNLISLVVCGIRPSVHAAYQANAEEIGVSVTSVYNKLNGIEPSVSAAVVRHTATQLEPLINSLGGELPDLLPGYRVKILDGNHLAATEHRLEVLRYTSCGALPGKSLVVLDPALMLAVDVFPCEDGHAQERSLLNQVLATVATGEVWIGDRNFCTRDFLFGLVHKQSYFVIRQHGNLPWQAVAELHPRGHSETGAVFEQTVQVTDEAGQVLNLRRVVVKLDKPTRDGEWEIAILTNLPLTVADALKVQQLYQKRWKLETLFQVLTETLSCEIKTLGYPKAALFGFCMALVAYNVLSVVKASLRCVHGVGKIEAGLSNYYLADEVQGTYRGMMIAIPPSKWVIFSEMTVAQLSELLQQLAGQVRLSSFRSHPRGPKKPLPERTRPKNQTHVSTAKLLAQAKKRN